MRLVTPRKILIIVIMFFGFIGLSALGRPSQNEKIMVVTMVGIDRTADEYEVSVKAVIPAPNENGSSSEKVFSGTGDSIALAMNNITIQVGNGQRDSTEEIDYTDAPELLPEEQMEEVGDVDEFQEIHE